MSQILTDEEITLIIRECARGSAINRDGSTSHRIARAIEQAILNKLSEQEPVAWNQAGKPLYLHPAPSVPEGYVLAPVVPTGEMNGAGYKAFSISDNPSDCYKAMLSAARSE